MGLLIHFFHRPSSLNQPPPLVRKSNHIRAIDGEVTVNEVKRFIEKNKEMQREREKNRHLFINNVHERENQKHDSSIEPFVRFDVYEKLLNDNEELRNANNFITDLLYSESVSAMDEKFNNYFKEHPSLRYD